MKVLLIIIGLVLLLSACTPTNEKLDYDSCYIGCLAGLNHNGTDFVEMEIGNIGTKETLMLNECNRFCYSKPRYTEI